MKYFVVNIIIFITLISLVSADYRITDGGVIFIYNNKDAKEVYLAGDFTNWEENKLEMKRDSTGVFSILVDLSAGKHLYKFIVDGVWMEDPDNSEVEPDNYGGNNSIIYVKKSEENKSIQSGALQKDGKAIFKYYNPDAEKVYLAGEFNNWKPDDLLMNNNNGEWEIALNLPPGKYQYKFVVDGNWTTDPLNPVVEGDMGNSVIIIGDDGTASYPLGKSIISNSTSSSRILFSGLLATRFNTYMDKYTAQGDRRWRLDKPEVEVGIDFNIHITKNVSAQSSFDVNSCESDTIYTTHINLDSISLSLKESDLNITAFYNKGVFKIDDPLGIISCCRYAEPTFESKEMFGLGYTGIAANYRINKSFLNGTEFNILLANLFKDWTLKTDSLDFPNLPGRRKIGFWSMKIISSKKPDDFSDYGTDVIAGRISKNFSFLTTGFELRLERNGWWLPLDEITIENMDSIISENNLHSDWYDIGSQEIAFGGDIMINIVPDYLKLWYEYIDWGYSSSIDAGNRENSDNTGDSTLNIGLGNQDGYLTGAGVDANIVKNLSFNVMFEIEHYDRMDSGEVYIEPIPTSGETGRPNLTYETLGEYNRMYLEHKLNYNGKSSEIGFSYIRENVKDENNINLFTLDILLKLFNDKLVLKTKGIYSFGEKLNDLRAKMNGVDIILNAKYNIWKNYFVEGDVYLKNIGYDYMDIDTTEDINNSYIIPYVSLLYIPKKNVNFELSFGLRPYNILGKYTGREEWIYNVMEQNSINYLDALKRMKSYNTINVVALFKF